MCHVSCPARHVRHVCVSPRFLFYFEDSGVSMLCVFSFTSPYGVMFIGVSCVSPGAYPQCGIKSSVRSSFVVMSSLVRFMLMFPLIVLHAPVQVLVHVFVTLFIFDLSFL